MCSDVGNSFLWQHFILFTCKPFMWMQWLLWEWVSEVCCSYFNIIPSRLYFSISLFLLSAFLSLLHSHPFLLTFLSLLLIAPTVPFLPTANHPYVSPSFSPLVLFYFCLLSLFYCFLHPHCFLLLHPSFAVLNLTFLRFILQCDFHLRPPTP